MYQLQLPFGEAVKRALTVNYCNFKGRASRSEYWWFMLFIFIAMIAVSVIFCWSETLSSIALGIVYLGILLPALGLSVRRMHDIGRSAGGSSLTSFLWWAVSSTSCSPSRKANPCPTSGVMFPTSSSSNTHPFPHSALST